MFIKVLYIFIIVVGTLNWLGEDTDIQGIKGLLEIILGVLIYGICNCL